MGIIMRTQREGINQLSVVVDPATAALLCCAVPLVSVRGRCLCATE